MAKETRIIPSDLIDNTCEIISRDGGECESFVVEAYKNMSDIEFEEMKKYFLPSDSN